MKGIYLTEEGKKEIEDKIAELETELNSGSSFVTENYRNRGEIAAYKKILSLATILPVEESWDDVELYPPDNESQTEKTLKLINGVIIQPKQ